MGQLACCHAKRTLLSPLCSTSHLCSTIASMTIIPNPPRFGGDTGGPSRSVQLMTRVSPSMPQLISTRPFVGRGRTIFTGVGGEFVERKPDGLCGSLVQAQLRAIH